MKTILVCYHEQVLTCDFFNTSEKNRYKLDVFIECSLKRQQTIYCIAIIIKKIKILKDKRKNLWKRTNLLTL